MFTDPGFLIVLTVGGIILVSVFREALKQPTFNYKFNKLSAEKII